MECLAAWAAMGRDRMLGTIGFAAHGGWQDSVEAIS